MSARGGRISRWSRCSGRPTSASRRCSTAWSAGSPRWSRTSPASRRDRRYGVCDWGPARFRVVDTGGLDPLATGILAAMRQQTLRALDEADVVAFVVDAREGVTAVDSEVAKLLHRSGKPVLVAANKVDSEGRGAAREAFSLGFPDVFPVSASHGRGVSQFLDALVRAAARGGGTAATRAAPPPRRDDDDRPIRHRVRGQAERRQVVAGQLPARRGARAGHDAAGTRPRSDRHGVLVRRARVRAGRHRGHAPARDRSTRAPSTCRRRWRADQIERCDVAVLVVDAREAATAEDARLAGEIEDSGRARWSCSTRRTWSGVATSTPRSRRRARRWRSSPTRP
jgi:GTP-binding protein